MFSVLDFVVYKRGIAQPQFLCISVLLADCCPVRGVRPNRIPSPVQLDFRLVTLYLISCFGIIIGVHFPVFTV